MGLSHSLTARAAGLRLSQKTQRQQNKLSIMEIKWLSEKLLQQGMKDRDEGMAAAPSDDRGIQQIFEREQRWEPCPQSSSLNHTDVQHV